MSSEIGQKNASKHKKESSGNLMRLLPAPRIDFGKASALYAILGNRRLTDEIPPTDFCLIEISLNKSPLTSVSSDANDLDALTPNHCLLGYRSTFLPSLNHVDENDHREWYVRSQAYANAIWKRWLKNALSQ